MCCLGRMQASCCCCCSLSLAPPRNLPQKLHLGMYCLPNQKTLASEIWGLRAGYLPQHTSFDPMLLGTGLLTFTLHSGSFCKIVGSSGVALTQGMGSGWVPQHILTASGSSDPGFIWAWASGFVQCLAAHCAVRTRPSEQLTRDANKVFKHYLVTRADLLVAYG